MNILQTVLKAVELPAGVAHLDSGLADVNTDTFSLKTEVNIITSRGECRGLTMVEVFVPTTV